MDPNNPNYQGPPNGGGGFFQRGPDSGPVVRGGGPMLRHAVGVGPGFWIERIVMLVVVLLILALLLFLLYRALSPSGRWGANAAALRELALRYARGEIGRDEFLQRQADLTTPIGKALPPLPPGPPGAAPPAAPPPAPPPRGAQAPS